MSVYNHRVQYYETDRMGIVHHSNYVRWMEEARVDFLARLGFPYDVMEARGVISRCVPCAVSTGRAVPSAKRSPSGSP